MSTSRTSGALGSMKNRTTGSEGGGRLSTQTGGAGVRTTRQARQPNGSTLNSSTQRRSQAGGSKMRSTMQGTKKQSEQVAKEIQVFDDKGVDVTPKSLLSVKPTVLGQKGMSLLGEVDGDSTPTSGNTDSDLLGTGSGMSWRDRSMLSGSSTGSMTPTSDGGDTACSTPHGELQDVVAEDKDKPRQQQPKPVAPKVVEEEVLLTEGELEGNVYITLKETDTIWLLDLPAKCVGADAAEAPEVEAANARYKKVLRDREGSEMFVCNGAQTLDPLHKNKEVQTSAKEVKASDCQVTVWDIVDTLAKEEEGDSAADDLMMTRKDKKDKKKKEKKLPGLDAAPGEAGAELREAEAKKASLQVLDLSHLERLTEALVVMERAVVQNVYHDKLLHYRNFRPREGMELPENPPVEEADAPLAAPDQALHHLWDYKCDITEGRNVSCIAANHTRNDVLAVGYGQFEFSDQKDGMVAFWSLKNPEYPAWFFKSECGVTALAFSYHQPSLLAVGFYDGMVAIYDVRTPTHKPMLESGHTSGKHSDPVWKLQWVERGEVGESLISISTDGRVTQWSIKKGLEHTDLMKLKRVHRRTIPTAAAAAAGEQAASKTEAFISRRSSGMCFDFSPRDTNIYLTGTEDGNIHKCSCSYNEQYLESYFGHSGPLYQIQWSPFASNLFLSASADWTVKLWAEESENAIITFQSGNEEVADLQWSPTNSTVFGTVTCDGRLEIWDLTVSTLKPILEHTLKDVKLSTILFVESSPIVLCGGDNGAVSVFRMVGVEHPDTTAEEELTRLEEAMSSNIVAPDDDKKESN